MNRRDFSRLSAFTLAATQLPAQSPSQKPVGYAAIGLGRISDLFMQACAQSTKSKITALVTGHPVEKGEKFAAMYGIPKSSIYTYETFDRIRDNKDVDAVYVGLPNSMHAEYTTRAAKAGKHVLCEKPMAISVAEGRSMIDACHKANVRLMIAYRLHYDPTWKHAFDLIRSGELGQVESFMGGYWGFQPAEAWRVNRKLAGGGSLMDLGIYPLNCIRYLTGEEPSTYAAMVATREHSPRFSEVEQSVEWSMKFPSGIIGSCASSYGASGPALMRINCEKGYLELGNCFTYDGIHLKGQIGSGSTARQIEDNGTGKRPFQFTLEADHFSDCIRNNREADTPGEEGLKDMLAMEAIYKSAGTPLG